VAATNGSAAPNASVQTRPRLAPDHGWPVWGHDSAVGTLKDAVLKDRVRHAYLVSGPQGVGKTTLATAFARVLVCQAPPQPGLACGACLSCRKIGRGVHPDVQTFSLATQAAASEKSGGKNTSLTIETVREIAAGTALRPTEARWRVVVVEDAETLQAVAQEAFLKTLEEPPRFVVILLLCDDPELLLPTIRSRCEPVDLRRAPRSAVIDSLRAAGVAEQSAQAIADQAGGLPGLARRIADDPKQLARAQESIDRALAWIGSGAYERLVTAVRLGDSFSKRRAEVFADLETLLGVWRDALLLHAAQHPHLTYRGIAERLHALAGGWTLADLHRAVDATLTCIADLEANVRPRLALETMVLRWPILPSAPVRPPLAVPATR
jgi:DNA polymerase-3 subunit delta'